MDNSLRFEPVTISTGQNLVLLHHGEGKGVIVGKTVLAQCKNGAWVFDTRYGSIFIASELRQLADKLDELDEIAGADSRDDAAGS